MNWVPPGFQPPGWQPPDWQPGTGGGSPPASPPATGFRVSRRKPTTRVVSAKSVSLALSGPEQPYPVYQFSNRVFVERKGHNPFDGL